MAVCGMFTQALRGEVDRNIVLPWKPEFDHNMFISDIRSNTRDYKEDFTDSTRIEILSWNLEESTPRLSTHG